MKFDRTLAERLLKEAGLFTSACYNGGMRRIFHWRLWVPLLVALMACKAVAPAAPTATWLQPLPTIPTLEASPSPTVTETLAATATETLAATATAIPIPSPTTQPIEGELEVRFHPDGGLFVGDQVSMEVISPAGVDMNERLVRLRLDGEEQAQAGFGAYGIARRTQATFLWVWDTSQLEPGSYQLTFSIEPGGPTWTETINLLPQEQMPFPGLEAAWASTESDCCLVHYITGTPVERDLETLLDILDSQSLSATQRMGVELSEPIQVIFIPRVLGHGGFASDGIWISYLDRNYAGSNSDIVFHHEMVHVLDGRLGGELRPTLLVEGLAVYLSGGHFKPEELIPRAAALLPAEPGCIPLDQVQSSLGTGEEVCGLDQYIPLTPLVDDFYNAQHEISYLQAGALVEYMVDRWGWETYSAFYRDIHNQPLSTEDVQEIGGPQYQAIQTALKQHFDLTFEKLEEDFLAMLKQERITLETVQDVHVLTRYYDTLRRYQQLMDPSAYFATAWLLDGEQMRQRQIVADYLRQPLTDENLALEAMLLSANQDLLMARYAQAVSSLEAIGLVLDQLEQKGLQQKAEPAALFIADAFAVHPLAQDAFLLVRAARNAGFIPQRITIENDLARVWANADSPDLVELQFNRQMQGWQLISIAP